MKRKTYEACYDGMNKELYEDIVMELKESEITLKFGTAGQGGTPLDVFLNSKKIGTYTFWNFEKKSHQENHLGTAKEVDLANGIMKWDGNNYVGDYIDSENLLADTYSCEFYLDGEAEDELWLSINGEGDWGFGEFETSGAMEILKTKQ